MWRATRRPAALDQRSGPHRSDTTHLDRGQATPGLLARIAIRKYVDHLPLYRQEAIFARAGIALKHWLDDLQSKVLGHSSLAHAVNYALKRWVALARVADDGRYLIDNNRAENAIRPPVLSVMMMFPVLMPLLVVLL